MKFRRFMMAFYGWTGTFGIGLLLVEIFSGRVFVDSFATGQSVLVLGLLFSGFFIPIFLIYWVANKLGDHISLSDLIISSIVFVGYLLTIGSMILDKPDPILHILEYFIKNAT